MLERLTTLSLVLVLFSQVSLGQTTATSLVTTEIDSGTIAGELLNESTGMRVFRGIPYAAPPIDDLRWRPPQAVKSWEGTRDCTEFGKRAPQKPISKNQSEDCLFANVWTTKPGGPGDSESKLPVMVWIHGGGLNKGAGYKEFYDGVALASRGVVLVSFNYRLGALGFLAHPGLSAESKHGVSGNYGFLDQIAALRWVQLNAASFGGDPNNVTIFGESAGGTSVAVLCTSPLAKDLFHRAILQSPWMFGYINQLAEPNTVFLRKSIANTPSAEELGNQWASNFNDLGDNDGQAIHKLRSLTTKEILSGSKYYQTRVTVDGHVLPLPPVEAFAVGKQSDVPTMIGTTNEEGNYFANWVQSKDRTEFVGKLRHFYGDATKALSEKYPGETQEKIKRAGSRFVTDAWFVQPSRRMLFGMNRVKSPAFQYEFAQPNRNNPSIGTVHAADLRYVFNTLKNVADRPDDQKVADLMSDYWTQFAKTGDPNREGLPEWPKFDRDSRRYIELKTQPEVKLDLLREACDALDKANEGI